MAWFSLWPFSTAQKCIRFHLFCIYHNGPVAGRLDSELWLPGIADKHCMDRISAVLFHAQLRSKGYALTQVRGVGWLA
jgi:hypothetical protein